MIGYIAAPDRFSALGTSSSVAQGICRAHRAGRIDTWLSQAAEAAALADRLPRRDVRCLNSLFNWRHADIARSVAPKAQGYREKVASLTRQLDQPS